MPASTLITTHQFSNLIGLPNGPGTSMTWFGVIAAIPGTFGIMIEEFARNTAPLLQLANIVPGADTARPELTPQSADRFAAPLGYLRMHRDGSSRLEAAMRFYGARYPWCQDAIADTHNWPSTKPGA
jgi:hypothetical protein